MAKMIRGRGNMEPSRLPGRREGGGGRGEKVRTPVSWRYRMLS